MTNETTQVAIIMGSDSDLPIVEAAFPILESFGAEVFNLPISKTTLLNAYWGIGTLIGFHCRVLKLLANSDMKPCYNNRVIM